MKKYKLADVVSEEALMDFVYQFLKEESQLESVRLLKDLMFFKTQIDKVETYLTKKRLYEVQFKKSKVKSIMVFESAEEKELEVDE